MIETIYETAQVGLCVLNRECRYVRINARLAEMNGLPAADHLGKTVREVAPGIADTAEAIAAQILRTGQPVLDHEISGATAAQPGI